MRVDYLGLEAFVAIADYGSFLRAAQALNLSQAALSHRLRKVEDDLGTALLTRTSREVSLTAVGQGLLPEARRLLTAIQDTYESVRAGAQRQVKRFSFACTPTIAHSVLPAVLADFAREKPGVGFEMLEIPVVRIPEVVRRGAAEFGLTVMSAELPDLRMRPIVDEDYMLFVHRDNPIASQESVTLDDILGTPLARISSQSKNRQLLDVAFGEARDKMIWQYEVQSASFALRIVSSGAAMTILPASAVLMAPDSIVALPFSGIQLNRTIGVVSRRGIPLSDVATAMLSRIETQLLQGALRRHGHDHFSPADGPRPRG